MTQDGMLAAGRIRRQLIDMRGVEGVLPAIAVSCFVLVSLLEAFGGVGGPLLFGRPAGAVVSIVVLAAAFVGIWLLIVGGSEGYSRPSAGRPVSVVVVTALVASPILLLGVIGLDIKNADGPVLLSAIDYVWGRGSPEWLLESQDAPLPHLLYGVPLALGSSADRLVLLPVLMTVVLACWVASQVFRRTGAADVSVLAGMALVYTPAVFGQASRLPLYPIFAIAGLVGLAALKNWIEDGRLAAVLLGSVAIAIAVASHGAGLYYAPMAFLTVIFVTSTATFKRWLLAMIAVGLANSPWLLAHLWISGFDRLLTPRDSWFLTNGHLLVVNEEFWELAVGSRLATLANLPGLYFEAAGMGAVALLVLSGVGLRQLGQRSRWFVLAGLFTLWAPLALSRSAGFVRYYYPVLPAVAVLAGLGLAHLLKSGQLNRFRPAIVMLLVVLVGSEMRSSLQEAAERRIVGDEFAVEMAEAAALIDDGKGVFGYRSFFLNLAEPQLDTYAHDLSSEDAYLSLYRWDEDALRTQATELNLGYVMLTRPTSRWEEEYNDVWLQAGFSTSSVHVDRLRAGDCLLYEGQHLELYDLSLCLDGVRP